jgi:glycerophosphoryl diester phosphodiesterase
MSGEQKVYRRAFCLLRNNSPLLIGQGIILALFFLLFIPLLNHVFSLMLRITGFSYVTPDNLGRFLLHPLNIVILILLFLLISLFFLFEVNFLVTCLSLKLRNQKARVLRLTGAAAYRAFFGLVKGKQRLISTLWLTLIVLNLPVLFFAARKIRLLRFFIGEIQGGIFWITVAFLIVGALLLKLYRRMFVFHYCSIPHTTCTSAVKSGRDFRNHRPMRTLLYFLGWNAAIIVVLLLLYFLTMAFTTLIVSVAFEKNYSIAVFISISEKIENYFIIVIFLVTTIGNFALGTQLFYQYNLTTQSTNEEDLLDGVPRDKKISVRRVLLPVCAVIIGFNLYLVINVLRNGSALNSVNLFDIHITAHRGFSKGVPENTIPAIEKAIDEQSDYVELDVRVTRDGELVLLHDGSLRRTTGVKNNIWDVDYADIETLDAGSWLSAEYSEVTIPRLREVMELCKGRINLNLDLKYRSAAEGLEEKIVALISEYDMYWQCVVTSTSLTCLEKIKELDPNIRTGYIMYRFQPSMLTNDAVDLFSIKSTLVSWDIVRKIHQSGKILYVWTVNSSSELQRMSRLGVDNIITDNPTYARRVLYQIDSEKYMVTLLKILLE